MPKPRPSRGSFRLYRGGQLLGVVVDAPELRLPGSPREAGRLTAEPAFQEIRPTLEEDCRLTVAALAATMEWPHAPQATAAELQARLADLQRQILAPGVWLIAADGSRVDLKELHAEGDVVYWQ